MFKEFLLVALLCLNQVANAASPPTAVKVYGIKAGALASANHTSTDTGDASVYQKPIDVGLSTHAAVQCNWAALTGVLNGTISLYSSADAVNWVPKAGATFNVASASGSNLISLNDVVSEADYQIVYLHGGITGGTIECLLWGK